MENLDHIKLLGHGAYLLILCSFLVRRVLALRLFAVAASCCSIAYNHHVSGGPLWIPIQWNVLFISVNLYHITMALLARRKIVLPLQEENAYQMKFKTMERVEFKRLLAQGHTRTYHKGERLVQKNDLLGAVFLILEGEAKVLVSGQKVGGLTSGEFIGEMSFLTGCPTTADVIISVDSRIHYWDAEDLKAFFSKNPSVLAGFHSAIGSQLIGKIISSSSKEEAQEKIAA